MKLFLITTLLLGSTFAYGQEVKGLGPSAECMKLVKQDSDIRDWGHAAAQCRQGATAECMKLVKQDSDTRDWTHAAGLCSY